MRLVLHTASNWNSWKPLDISTTVSLSSLWPEVERREEGIVASEALYWGHKVTMKGMKQSSTQLHGFYTGHTMYTWIAINYSLMSNLGGSPQALRSTLADGGLVVEWSLLDWKTESPNLYHFPVSGGNTCWYSPLLYVFGPVLYSCVQTCMHKHIYCTVIATVCKVHLFPLHQCLHIPTEVFLFLMWQEHNLHVYIHVPHKQHEHVQQFITYTCTCMAICSQQCMVLMWDWPCL